MNVQKWLMTMTVTLSLSTSLSSYGQCPVQETTVMHINGVNVEKSEADESRNKLKIELLKQPRINSECISARTLYNTSTTLSLDLVEAAIQKVQELDKELPDFWKTYFRVLSLFPDHEFLGVISDWYAIADFTNYVTEKQLQKHLTLVRNELDRGKQVILIPHSQGNFYANAIWDALDFDEQSRVHIVSAATPSDTVADGGDYTTLEEDGFAQWFFAFALPANASNDEICPSEWYCHGFGEWYLTGRNSRDRIIDDIVSLLPTIDPCAIQGTIRTIAFQVTPNGKLIVKNTVFPYDRIAEYMADATGNYCVPRSDIENGTYRVEAYDGSQLLGTSVATVSSEWTWSANFPIPAMW